MPIHELTPTGTRHLNEAMQPYDELRMVQRMLETALDGWLTKNASAYKLHEDLRDAHDSLRGGADDADGNLFDIELKRDALAETLMEERAFVERSVDD